MSTDRLAALRACWHPVAYADTITGPHATMLLGEPLVLWRDALHLTFDAVAVAYRRAMRGHGFG